VAEAAEIEHLPWESKLTFASRCKTASRLLPYAVRHMGIKPFRSTPQAKIISAGFDNWQYRRAAHDMYCEMLIQGYQQVTSMPVSPDAGLAVVLFVVFIFTFDQEFERRSQSGKMLGYPIILATPAVSRAWQALTLYLEQFGRSESIAEHLLRTFEEHYVSYCRYLDDAVSANSFGAVLKLVEYDSGRSMLAAYEIIRLFHGHQQHQACAHQFFALGMAGKFLDDFRDVAADVASGNPNLLYALTSEHEGEKQALEAALRERRHIALRWWRRHCPESFGSYLDQAFAYYDQVRSPKLQLPLDICLALLYSPQRGPSGQPSPDNR